MGHLKPAFDVNDEAYISLNPVDGINAMFSHTDGEGRLRIPPGRMILTISMTRPQTGWTV